MNESSTAQSLRERLPLAPQIEKHFRWRGVHVSRVEGFTDAVFAFAVTLLVVFLEVPHDYEGLLDVVRGFPAFIISFAILMTFWSAHFRFHRRYGLEDWFTRLMTMAILVLVLFFVYPLKFLFTLVTVNLFQLALRDPPHLETAAQGDVLYLIYGLGFAGVWGLYALLYWNALRKRDELQLTPIELVQTRGSLCEYLVHISVCALSITLAFTTDNNSLPGMIYFLIGPAQSLVGWYFGRQYRALAQQLTA
jgi:uncharacterized membrane protein